MLCLLLLFWFLIVLDASSYYVWFRVWSFRVCYVASYFYLDLLLFGLGICVCFSFLLGFDLLGGFATCCYA